MVLRSSGSNSRVVLTSAANFGNGVFDIFERVAKIGSGRVQSLAQVCVLFECLFHERGDLFVPLERRPDFVQGLLGGRNHRRSLVEKHGHVRLDAADQFGAGLQAHRLGVGRDLAGRGKIDARVAAENAMNENGLIGFVEGVGPIDIDDGTHSSCRVVQLNGKNLADADPGPAHRSSFLHARSVLEDDHVMIGTLEDGRPMAKEHNERRQENYGRENKDPNAEAHILFVHGTLPL